MLNSLQARVRLLTKADQRYDLIQRERIGLGRNQSLKKSLFQANTNQEQSEPSTWRSSTTSSAYSAMT